MKLKQWPRRPKPGTLGQRALSTASLDVSRQGTVKWHFWQKEKTPNSGQQE